MIAAAIVLFAAALIVASGLMCAALSVGSKAPSFKLTSFGGKTIKLSDYTNKPTVLVFWASWCPHCRRELPVVDRVYRDFRSKGVNIIGINVDRSTSDGRSFVSKERIAFPMVIGKEKVAESYQVNGIPAIFILGKGGVIKAKHVGALGESALRAELAKLGAK